MFEARFHVNNHSVRLLCQVVQQATHGRLCATHTAGTPGNVDRIGGFTALQNDLIAAEERGLGTGLYRLTAFEVNDGVERQSTPHARHRINVKVAQVRVPDSLCEWRGVLTRREWFAPCRIAQLGTAMDVELDGQVFEAHRTSCSLQR